MAASRLTRSFSLHTIILLLCFMIMLDLGKSRGAIIFTHEPRDIIIYEGQTARFECSFEGSNLIPTWKINDSYYHYTQIPQMFEYNNHDFSLSVLNASTDLNSTSFQCIVGRAASSTGLLMVLNLSLEFKDNVSKPTETSTAQHTFNERIIDITLPLTSHSESTFTTLKTGTPLIKKEEGTLKRQMVVIIVTMVSVVIVAAVIVSISVCTVVLGIFKYKHKDDLSNSSSNINADEREPEELELASNAAYGIHKKVPLKINLAYEDVSRVLRSGSPQA